MDDAKSVWKSKQDFSNFYSPSEYLAVDEVIVLFQGRVIFQQYIPKKHKYFDIKICKGCDKTVYTYDMTVFSLLIYNNNTQQKLVCLGPWWCRS